MVNIRLAMIGKRAKLELPAGARDRRAQTPARQREVYFADARKAAALPGLPARGARRRQRASPARR